MNGNEPIPALDYDFLPALRKHADEPPERMLNIAPIVVRTLNERARQEPDGIEAGLAKLCAPWATREGGAIIPAGGMAAIFAGATGPEADA